MASTNNYSWLHNTGCCRPRTIIHIFEGELKRGDASGYHYEGISNTPGRVVPGTRTVPDRWGVYKAMVMVNGVLKRANGGFSTFFPRYMTPQDVINCINEAYNARVLLQGTKNTYQGFTSSGMKIEMYLDSSDKIISAFPIYHHP